MKYLGVDYGSKRIGLAVSDENGKIAFPKETVAGGNLEKAIKYIAGMIEKEQIDLVVVGLPITFSGRESKQTSSTRNFIADLKKTISIPVHTQNEVLTSSQAKKFSTEKTLDSSSAALILQSYLDKIKD